MMNCLFCKIVAGEIPSTKVFEDETSFAFLDIAPVSKGHTLIVPKVHAENLISASAETLSAMMPTVQLMAKAAVKAVGAEGFNLHVNNGRASGQLVDHLHFHIIPRFAHDGLEHWPKIAYAEGEAQVVGEKIRKSLM
jgi:histidine triad (HIT) family protein